MIRPLATAQELVKMSQGMLVEIACTTITTTWSLAHSMECPHLLSVKRWSPTGPMVTAIQQTPSAFSFTELSVNYAILSADMPLNLGPQVAPERAKAYLVSCMDLSDKLAICLWSLLVPWDSDWAQSWIYQFHF